MHFFHKNIVKSGILPGLLATAARITFKISTSVEENIFRKQVIILVLTGYCSPDGRSSRLDNGLGV